jgi:hypothetical protein
MLLALLFISSAFAAPPMREAPNMVAAPANQLLVSGNACGPAALLNAFRFGAPHWQRAATGIAGNNDRERILTIIREIGMRPSKHLPGRPRWSRRGVGVSDLRDIAADMSHGHFLPYISEEVFILKPRETPEKLLRRVHHRLESSLARGLPPVISLRRLTLRPQGGGTSLWTVIDAHFVTLTALPRRPGKADRSFPVRYIDPWGGRHCEGVISIPENPAFADAKGRPSSLEAVFPHTPVGAKLVRHGENSLLTVAAGIGKW